MNDFIGVFGGASPAATLNSLGVEPVWDDQRVAFGGAPVWETPAGGVVLCGDVVLDNAPALRSTLELPDAAPGELLAALYLRYGANAGHYAMGMFAVAVWDTRHEQLVLMRDGVGARTMYYAGDGRPWWFATALRTLKRTPVVSGQISLTALRNCLTYSFVPGAETLWKDASELRPGTTLSLPSGKIDTYWEPAEGCWDPDETIDDHAARLRVLLEDAVKIRLPSSGPAGVFLSGGLDSSLVTALATRYPPVQSTPMRLTSDPNIPMS